MIIKDVWIRDSDEYGIHVRSGSDHLITNCVFESTDNARVSLDGGSRCIVSNCNVETKVDGSGNDAINIDNNDDIILIGNLLHNAGGNGVRVPSNSYDNIVANNRISDSSGSDTSISSSSTKTDSNLTGSAY
jgi:hypothetical protein